jgi:hypothetical protein
MWLVQARRHNRPATPPVWRIILNHMARVNTTEDRRAVLRSPVQPIRQVGNGQRALRHITTRALYLMRRVSATIVAAERQWVLQVCTLGDPACNAHVPYCHLWPAPLYRMFPHYLIHGTIFRKKLLTIKCVSSFSTTLSEIFLIIRRTERYVIKNVYW